MTADAARVHSLGFRLKLSPRDLRELSKLVHATPVGVGEASLTRVARRCLRVGMLAEAERLGVTLDDDGSGSEP